MKWLRVGLVLGGGLKIHLVSSVAGFAGGAGVGASCRGAVAAELPMRRTAYGTQADGG